MRYTLVYVGIQVRDMERSVSFYRDVLGMQVVRRQHVPETGGEWAELRSIGSKQMLELNWYPDASKFFAGPYRTGDELDHIAFECEDVERAYGELLEKGARAGHAPFAEGNSWLAYVEDPDGIWIELTGPFLANQPQARPTRRGPREARGRSGHRPRGSPCLPGGPPPD